MTIDQVDSICRTNGLPLTPKQLAMLTSYADRLRDWNSKINLVSRKDTDNILSKHVLHALTLRMPALCGYKFDNKRVLDIGTGGGLPGIPLRIVTPSATVTLVDSIQKKIMVCNDIIEGLGLQGIRAIHGRAEEIARQKEHYRSYDVVVSRAVAPLDDLLKWTHDLLRLGGTLFSLKGGDLTEEIERSKKLKYVRSVQEVSLALQGYDEFLTEGKKLIRVECT